MILPDSLRAVDGARWGDRFVRPRYDDYSFAHLPRLIPSLFSGDMAPQAALLGPLSGTYRTVILLFIDAFGWRFLQQYGEQYPFLRRMMREGVTAKITAQFPSTTTAHLTTIHTGLPVGQSGMYEWFYYEPEVDAVIAPLMFSFAGDRERDTLAQAGVDPQRLFPRETIYDALGAAGVRSVIFGAREYTPSTAGNIFNRGARVVPYVTLADGLAQVAEAALSGRDRGYYFLYFGGIDLVGHVRGPGSPEFAAAVDECFTALESVLHARLAGKLGNALLLFTADHGQIEVDPRTTVYLNEAIPEIERWLERNRAGQLLVPAGSPRDMFLYIRPEHLAEVESRLRELLAGKAEVHRVAELAREGFFGSEAPSEVFLRRAGDLVVLPYAYETVWWKEPGRFSQNFYGYHGGLTPEEMETELLALPYN